MIVYKLDLSSLESVRACATILLENEQKIDILINNAGKTKYIHIRARFKTSPEYSFTTTMKNILSLFLGVMNYGIPTAKTKDGFEMQFGTNHLGHFLLTELLIPLLHTSSASGFTPRLKY